MPADSPPNGFALDGRRPVGRRAGDQPEEHLPPKASGEQIENRMVEPPGARKVVPGEWARRDEPGQEQWCARTGQADRRQMLGEAFEQLVKTISWSRWRSA